MSIVIEKTGIVLPEGPQSLRDPSVETRPRKRTRRKVESRTSPLLAAIAYSTRVAILSFVLVCVSSAVCQYLFEQARHAGNSANARAQTAESALAGLRRDVDRLQSAERLQTWASLNGFTASYLASNEKPK